LLSRLDAEGVESLRQGGDGLVGRQNALPLGNQRQRDALQIVACHGIPPASYYSYSLLMVRDFLHLADIARRSMRGQNRDDPTADVLVLTACQDERLTLNCFRRG